MDLARQVSAMRSSRRVRSSRETKSDLSDLAVFGGVPAFSSSLHVGRPNIGNRKRLLDRIRDVLDRRWLTNQGPLVQEFESEICKLLSATRCIATCNATTALEIVIRALNLT